jgi:hypothetical protein
VTDYATMGEIFRQARRGLRESLWVPVLVYCPQQPHGCFVGQVHQTAIGGVWNPKDPGLSGRKRKLAERMRRRSDIDWETPLEDADERTLRLMTYSLPPLPVPLDAFQGADDVQCECRDHGSSRISAALLRAKYSEAVSARKIVTTASRAL